MSQPGHDEQSSEGIVDRPVSWSSRDLSEVAEQLRRFATERDWEQFHSPKNLAMALAKEAAELMEPFQWLSSQESASLDEKKLQAVRDEIGDTLIYLIRLSDRLGIDPLAAAIEKIQKNDRKYPVEKVRGSAKKYTDL